MPPNEPEPYQLTPTDLEALIRARDLIQEAKGELGHIRDWWLALNKSVWELSHIILAMDGQ